MPLVAKRVLPVHVVAVVASSYGEVTPDEIRRPHRECADGEPKPVVEARSVCIPFLRDHFFFSFYALGKYLGGRDVRMIEDAARYGREILKAKPDLYETIQAGLAQAPAYDGQTPAHLA